MYSVVIYHKFRCDNCEDERVSTTSSSAPSGWLTIANLPAFKGVDEHLCEICAPVFVSLANQGLLGAHSLDKKDAKE